MSYGTIAESPHILHCAINVAHLGLCVYSVNSTSKQQGQFVRNIFEKLVNTNSSEGKQTFKSADNYMHVLNKNGRLYMCYTPVSTKFRVVYNLLDDLDLELTKIPRLINSNKSDILNILKETVLYYNDPTNDKITTLQKQIDLNKDKMIQNIDKVLANSDSMNVLISQTEDIKESATLFQFGSKKMKRNMQFRLFLVVFLIVLICSVVLGIAILLIALKIAGKI